MRRQREATEVLDDIEALLVELRAINLASNQGTTEQPLAGNIPNPRRAKPFVIGDRVVVLSRKHQHKTATIIGQKTEDFWNIILDDGTEVYRKFTSLRHL